MDENDGVESNDAAPWLLLGLAGGLLLFVAALVIYGTLTAEAPVTQAVRANRPLDQMPAPERLVAILAGTERLEPFRGLGARWEGRLTGLADQDRRLLFESGEQQFVACYDGPVGKQLKVGETYALYGTLEGREGAALLIRARGPPGPG